MTKIKRNMHDTIFDLTGIGIGPSNLSTAALLSPVKSIKAQFLDLKKEFQWHSGMLFPEATIQVSHLKDLVTLVDPTSKFSFLNFLGSKNRLYRFATARFPQVKRKEFNQYFQWVCSNLENLEFDAKVESVSFDGSKFTTTHKKGQTLSKNIVMACGLTPKLPPFVQKHKCSTVFHAVHYNHNNINPKGKKIIVVGGGQSGAEIVNRLISNIDGLPEKITWISNRSNFLPIDDSPFTNEFFTPNYSEFFFDLPLSQKQRLLKQQVLASDGIDNSLLEEIYRKLYEIELIDGHGKICNLQFDTRMNKLSPAVNGWNVTYKPMYSEKALHLHADIIILATGFEYKIPSFLDNILNRISLNEGKLDVNSDFSINWNGPKSNRIYLQNGAYHVRGVADPNLSLSAWRSAKIINSLVGERYYDIDDESSPFEWQAKKIIDQQRYVKTS